MGVVTTQLDPREERFVALYVENPNATRAYIAAGFNYSTEAVAATSAHYLLKKPKIRKAIDQRNAKFLQRYEVTPQRIINEFAKIAHANIDDYVVLQDDGTLTVDFSTATRDQLAALQSLEVEEHVSGRGNDTVLKRINKMKMHDRLRALENLAKIARMYPAERKELTGADGGPIMTLNAHAHKVDLTQLDWDQRQQLRQVLQSIKSQAGDADDSA